jgi:hypothetical protein
MSNGDRSTQMKSSGETADSKSNKDVTSGSCKCPSNDGWVEIALLGDEDAPIRDEACIITDPEGKEHKGKTDSKGMIRLEGIPEGECTVCFNELDEGAWGPEKPEK